MYGAKEDRARTCVFQRDMRRARLSPLDMETDLRRAWRATKWNFTTNPSFPLKRIVCVVSKRYFAGTAKAMAWSAPKTLSRSRGIGLISEQEIGFWPPPVDKYGLGTRTGAGSNAGDERQPVQSPV